MSEHSGEDELADWIINRSEHLDDHWQNTMEGEQAGFRSDGSHLQSDKIQNIAAQARNDIRKFRSELAGLEVSQASEAARMKCSTYLDNWDSFFYHMSKYDSSGELEELETATRAYKAVDVMLSGILQTLGLGSVERGEPFGYPQVQQSSTVSTRQVREKEIIREKEVIVKVKCPYCQRLYNEVLEECPRCGAKR